MKGSNPPVKGGADNEALCAHDPSQLSSCLAKGAVCELVHGQLGKAEVGVGEALDLIEGLHIACDGLGDA